MQCFCGVTGSRRLYLLNSCSTILTLFVLPALYLTVGKFKENGNRENTEDHYSKKPQELQA